MDMHPDQEYQVRDRSHITWTPFKPVQPPPLPWTVDPFLIHTKGLCWRIKCVKLMYAAPGTTGCSQTKGLRPTFILAIHAFNLPWFISQPRPFHRPLELLSFSNWLSERHYLEDYRSKVSNKSFHITQTVFKLTVDWRNHLNILILHSMQSAVGVVQNSVTWNNMMFYNWAGSVYCYTFRHLGLEPSCQNVDNT